ncbi:MAG: phage tail protein [Rhizomicrobium sp.]
MAQPYVGEIRLFAGNFAPAGWAFCAGQIMPISENETLFNLIGTTYGGDGQSTFQLPDLRGRAPMHMGNGATLAETGGSESVTLTVQQIPSHNHPLLATATGQALSPNGGILAVPTGGVQGFQTYATGAANTALIGSSIVNDGGNQPHENLQPYLCVSFIISLFGVYPSPT